MLFVFFAVLLLVQVLPPFFPSSRSGLNPVAKLFRFLPWVRVVCAGLRPRSNDISWQAQHLGLVPQVQIVRAGGEIRLFSWHMIKLYE